METLEQQVWSLLSSLFVFTLQRSFVFPLFPITHPRFTSFIHSSLCLLVYFASSTLFGHASPTTYSRDAVMTHTHNRDNDEECDASEKETKVNAKSFNEADEVDGDEKKIEEYFALTHASSLSLSFLQPRLSYDTLTIKNNE